MLGSTYFLTTRVHAMSPRLPFTRPGQADLSAAAFHPCHKNRFNIERIDACQTLMRGNLVVGGNIDESADALCQKRSMHFLLTNQSTRLISVDQIDYFQTRPDSSAISSLPSNTSREHTANDGWQAPQPPTTSSKR